jgi:hypothetical protein
MRTLPTEQPAEGYRGARRPATGASYDRSAEGPTATAERSWSAFVHLFIFEEEAAHLAHGQSEAVRRFEAGYRPELVGGPVVFTDYDLVATNGE